MKQKLIYTVLLLVSLYLPASSKECTKVFSKAVAAGLLQVKPKVAAEREELVALPPSPLFKL